MNLLEWRKSGEHRSLAMDVLNNPTLREMLAVMDSEHPGRSDAKLRDGFDATLACGEARGFQKALTMLRAFAEPLPVAPEAIPVTWNVDEQQPEIPK